MFNNLFVSTTRGATLTFTYHPDPRGFCWIDSHTEWQLLEVSNTAVHHSPALHLNLSIMTLALGFVNCLSHFLMQPSEVLWVPLTTCACTLSISGECSNVPGWERVNHLWAKPTKLMSQCPFRSYFTCTTRLNHPPIWKVYLGVWTPKEKKNKNIMLNAQGTNNNIHSESLLTQQTIKCTYS